MSKLDNIIIIWAGIAAEELIPLIKNKYNIVWLVDDSKQWDLLGLDIVWKIDDLEDILKKADIDRAFIAMPSVKKDRKYQIWKILNKHNVDIFIIPDLIDILSNKVEINLVKEIDINDILWRPLNKQDVIKSKNYIEWKVCLVTWAAWSIWSELVHQLATLWADKVYCLDRWENWLFYLKQKLEQFTCLDMVVADIQDYANLERIIVDLDPEMVFHAAAFKHVWLMEKFPKEAFKNNVFWTNNLLSACTKAKTKNVTIVSTDKAINPSSVMWGTKRIAEKLMEVYSTKNISKISAVRFWNVIWSEWSVFHIFKKQIDSWSPITITDPEVTRYMMTIPEAVQLIIQSTLLAENNEIFLLDMWVPIKITDFLAKILELRWISINDVQLEYIWLRKWEKLHEEIILDKNKSKKTHHDRIWVSRKEEDFDIDDFYKIILETQTNIDDMDEDSVRKIIKELVPNFKNNEQ